MKKIDTIPAAIQTLSRLEHWSLWHIALTVFNTLALLLIIERIFV